MTETRPADTWAQGEPYERFIGRWSRAIAREFVAWLSVPSAARWLDVGCGTGALTGVILESARPAAVRGIDPSEAFVAHARDRVEDRRAQFSVGDAQSLPFAAGEFDAAVAGLVLNFVPEPRRAVAELARVVRSGATVAAYVWDYADGMELIRYFWETAVELDATAAELHEGRRFPICAPGPLEDLWREAGLVATATRSIDVPTRFADFDDYWSPFLGGQGPAPAYATSLDEDRRAQLRERLRISLPTDRDGSIALTARAWAVRGIRP